MISFGDFNQSKTMSLWQAVSISIVLGLMGGCLGIGFCKGVELLNPIKERLFSTRWRRVGEVAALNILCSLISIALVMQLGNCRTGSATQSLADWSISKVL